MIVKMKKVYVIATKHDAKDALENLRDLGAIHVEPYVENVEAKTSRLKERVERKERVSAVLEEYKNDIAQQPCENCFEKVNELAGVIDKIERLKESVKQRSKRIKQWEKWGEFDPDHIRELAEQGVFIHLYEIPASQKIELPDDAVFETIYVAGGLRRCVVVLRKNMALPYERLPLPLASMKEKCDNQREDMEQIEKLENCLRDEYKYFEALQADLKDKRDTLRLQEVMYGMDDQDEITVLKGFCPADKCSALEQAAQQHRWGIFITDPDPDDNIPTLLRNPKWLDVVKPVFSMINIVPGYEEKDMSFLFCIFFVLFVGMLIGDAGYGLLIALITAVVHISSAKKVKDHTFFKLVYMLCGATIGWGVLTGVYFGQAWLPAAVKPFVPWLLDNYNIQMLCFLIGAIHLGLAHLWKALSYFPSMKSLPEFGWFVLVWVMFFMAKHLVLNVALPPFVMPALCVAVAFILLFPKPNMTPTFPLEVISCFTDVVSYIRLYAVGLATVAVADAANQMSVGWIVFLHVLNIMLAAMAILVHGLRLNVLEFSGHLGVQWSGQKYEPFCRKNE